MKKLFLYINTLKYLRLEQIFYRLLYLLFPLRKLPVVKSTPSINHIEVDFLNWQKESWANNGDATFLKITKNIDIYNNWQVTEEPLWQYNLHYFDDLNALNSQNRVEFHKTLISNWIRVNNDITKIAWDPYPISLRIVNWAKFFWRLDVLLPQEWLNSFEVQTEVLMKRLEFHILGNHLYANGKALVFAGILIKGVKGVRYLGKGLEILDRELEEQFMPDGAHFELSPMYHSILLSDLLELIELANKSEERQLLSRLSHWKKIAEKALHWFYLMLHQDKKISFFNDASFGIAPEINDIEQMASRLGIFPCDKNDAVSFTECGGFKVSDCKNSGYIIVESKELKCIADLANVGADYQPGHAHADTLSFELSLFGKRLFVNSGTSKYGNSIHRHEQRSTFSHNTLVLNNQNSSEVWGGFRVANRAKVIFRQSKFFDGRVKLTGVHNGYSTLIETKLHKRSWQFEDGSFSLNDTVSNSKNSEIKLYFYISPEWSVEADENNMVQITCENISIILEFENIDKLVIKNSRFYREFGVDVSNKCIIVTQKKSNCSSNVITNVSYRKTNTCFDKSVESMLVHYS